MHIKPKTFEHIYWPRLKVTIKLCFHLNNFNSCCLVFLIANQAEQHIFLSNHKISSFFIKIETPSFAEWYNIVTAGISCLLGLLSKSYFIFHKQWKILTILKCRAIFDHVLDQIFKSCRSSPSKNYKGDKDFAKRLDFKDRISSKN